MKFSYKSKWHPVCGVHQKFNHRGDEVRSFITAAGEEGELSVVSRSGGWMVSVKMGREIVYNTRGFGFRSKASAKQDAAFRLRAYLEYASKNDPLRAALTELCPD